MNNTTEKPAFSHTSFTVRGIFKGFTKNGNGTYFCGISLPVGSDNDSQAFINVSAIVAKKPALQAIAKANCDIDINDGRGTSAEVELTDLVASVGKDANGDIVLSEQGEPYINYTAFLNGIAFS